MQLSETHCHMQLTRATVKSSARHASQVECVNWPRHRRRCKVRRRVGGWEWPCRSNGAQVYWSQSEILPTPFGDTAFRVDRARRTVWLSQAEIADLLGIDLSVVARHLANIYKDGELEESSTCAFSAHMIPSTGPIARSTTISMQLSRVLPGGRRDRDRLPPLVEQYPEELPAPGLRAERAVAARKPAGR